jgi:hypothetical protein
MAASELDDVLATMLYAGVTRRLPDAKKMLAKHLGDWATSEAPRIITKLSGEGFTIVPTEQVGCCEQFHEAETALAAFRAFVHAYDLAEDAWELKPARNHARAAVEPFLRDDDV